MSCSTVLPASVKHRDNLLKFSFILCYYLKINFVVEKERANIMANTHVTFAREYFHIKIFNFYI